MHFFNFLFFLDVTLLTLHTEDVVAISSVPFINIGIEYLKILHSNQTEISDSRKGSRINIKILTCFHCLKVHFRLMLKKCYMRPLYNNRTELIAPNTSLAAVMIIKNPICWDEGTYRCWIVYFFRGLKKSRISDSVVEFNGFLHFANKNKISIK